MKELGKYFIDLSKYIATTVLISVLLPSHGNRIALILTASIIAGLFLVWGLACIKNNKNEKK